MKTTPSTLRHSTVTLIAISNAAMAAGGDFRATAAALARFCTEALADAAAGAYVPAKFNSDFPRYRAPTRDEAIARICGWVSYEKLMAWSADFSAELAYSDSWKACREVA